MGPLFYRWWFSREPIDDQFIKTTVGNVISRQQTTDDSRPDAHAASSA